VDKQVYGTFDPVKQNQCISLPFLLHFPLNKDHSFNSSIILNIVTIFKGMTMNRQCFSAVTILLTFSAVVFAQSKSIQIAGVSRKYIVHVPAGLTNPPLVFNIHGYNMDAASEQSYTKMDQIADREKFIVVYPEAIDKAWDLSGANDYTLILAIIDTIDAKYHIDRNRIYSCGFSMGGFMSFQLACRYSDIFAAIAPTSGLLNGTCNAKRPVPMRLTFGTDDVASSEQFMQSAGNWLKMCNCPETPVVTSPYPTTNPKSVVTRLYYGPCDQGSEVVVDSVRTGQHEWPMNTSDRINNSEETWAFLKKFTLQKSTDLRLQKESIIPDAVTLSYGNGIVWVQGLEKNCKVTVFDTRGRFIQNTVTMQNMFDFKGRSSGVYMVRVTQNNRPVALRIAVP
jgi:poly(3-hydroxybutyrate) depolymerase